MFALMLVSENKHLWAFAYLAASLSVPFLLAGPHDCRPVHTGHAADAAAL